MSSKTNSIQTQRKRKSMNWRQLAEVDDLASCLVLDPQVKFTTHKMNKEFTELEPTEFEHLQEIMEQFKRTENLKRTIKNLRNGGFLDKIGSKVDKKDLEEHIQRYLKAQSRDSGVKLESCMDYSEENEPEQVKVKATRKWRAGETMDIMESYVTKLRKKEADEIDEKGRGHFVIKSTGSSFLWLGPAANINHDCDPNCKMVRKGRRGYIQTIRDVAAGEELTCFYNANFFGEGNESCQCKTCKTSRGTKSHRRKLKNRKYFSPEFME